MANNEESIKVDLDTANQNDVSEDENEEEDYIKQQNTTLETTTNNQSIRKVRFEDTKWQKDK